MIRTMMFSVALTACVASTAELRKDADRDNPRRHDGALAAVVAQHHLVAATVPMLGGAFPGDAAPGVSVGTGDLANQLFARAATADHPASLVFMEAACESGSACGCDVAAEYQYFKDGDRVAIVRLVPDIHNVQVHVDSCGTGCGVPAPPQPQPLRDLGAIEPTAVELIQTHYQLDRVTETCDHPIPRP
jgi:hypothetical protein